MANLNRHLWSEHERKLKACYDDLITFGKVFLPGDFMKSKTPFFHYLMAQELIDKSNKPLAMIVFREAAKTCLVKAKLIRDLVFSKKAKEWGFDVEGHNEFIGWVSSNQKKSINNVAYIRLNLEYNDEINFYFGHPKTGNLKGIAWNQEDIRTIYGDRLVSSSNLTSMRGDTMATLHSGSVRYSKVVVDDAENEENTRTRNSREKVVDNIMNGILPAIDKHKDDARLIFIGTPVHFDSMAQNILDRYNKALKDDLLDEFTWKVLSWKVLDDKGNPTWPGWMTLEKLDEIKRIYEHSPRGIAGFYQEYFLEVQSRENALWTRDHIKYWEGYYKYHNDQNYLIINGEYVPVNTFLGCDPATDIETKNSDFSVIIAVAIDSSNNAYVLEYEKHRAIPTLGRRNHKGEIEGRKGVVDYIIELYDKYHMNHGTVEDVAMNRSVFQSLNDEKRRLNKFYVSIIPEKPGGRDKISRIYSRLNGRFAAGSIHYRENQYDLIDETVKFGPKMAHEDCIEALSYGLLHAFPPSLQREPLTGEFKKRKRRPRPWYLA